MRNLIHNLINLIDYVCANHIVDVCFPLPTQKRLQVEVVT